MLRATPLSAVPTGVSAVNGKLAVKVVLFAEAKPATSSSPGCVVVTFGVAGAAELPKAPAATSTRFAEAMPEESAALINLVEKRLVEKVTVILSPACSAVDMYPDAT